MDVQGALLLVIVELRWPARGAPRRRIPFVAVVVAEEVVVVAKVKFLPIPTLVEFTPACNLLPPLAAAVGIIIITVEVTSTGTVLVDVHIFLITLVAVAVVEAGVLVVEEEEKEDGW